MPGPLTIWLLNPYHTGSHRAWAEGYAAHSRHQVQVLAMSGQFWKWRMQGGPLELAAQATALLAQGSRPDLLLATSMVNLPAFLALVRMSPVGARPLSQVPVVLYMHENQLTYPPPPGTRRDLTYGMIQHLSMLAADRVCFNSDYHWQAWRDELPRLLKHFPDYCHLETAAIASHKAGVLPVACDLRRFDGYARAAGLPGEPPLILWNQRWEYDKDPQTMLRALYTLAGTGLEFRVALAGENFRVLPDEFAQAPERLGDRLVHYGYLEDGAAYARLLTSADVVLSTAIHEFFGVSVVEAIYCGCLPVLPARLSYPELIPPGFHQASLYHDFEGLVERLRARVQAAQSGTPVEAQRAALRAAMARFDWGNLAPVYDDLMAEVADGSPRFH